MLSSKISSKDSEESFVYSADSADKNTLKQRFKKVGTLQKRKEEGLVSHSESSSEEAKSDNGDNLGIYDKGMELENQVID